MTLFLFLTIVRFLVIGLSQKFLIKMELIPFVELLKWFFDYSADTLLSLFSSFTILMNIFNLLNLIGYTNGKMSVSDLMLNIWLYGRILVVFYETHYLKMHISIIFQVPSCQSQWSPNSWSIVGGKVFGATNHTKDVDFFH